MYLYYLYIFFLFATGGCSANGSPFISLSYKCKLVTITYWTLFNNTVNTRRTPLSSSLSLSLSAPWRATGTPYSLARFPAITIMTITPPPSFSLSHLLSFSLFLYLPRFHSLCLYLSLFLCNDSTLPLRRAVCYLPSRVPSAFSSRFSTRFLSQTSDIVIDWAKCIS